jgi:hypothetical protein
MMGLPKSVSVMPVARHRPRAPAMLRPWVVVADLSLGMLDLVDATSEQKGSPYS